MWTVEEVLLLQVLEQEEGEAEEAEIEEDCTSLRVQG